MAYNIPTITIGGKTTSALGYGAMGIGGAFYGAADSTEERLKVLDKLYELGERHIDSANVYGDSEALLGKWFKQSGKRDEIFLATKFGFDQDAGWKINGNPEFVHKSIDESLKKLDLPFVDLYYLHRPDPNVPIEITVGAMAELVKAGKVKSIGLSECTPETIRRAHKVHPIAAVQVEYSPFELIIEEPGGVKETCKELGIPIVAYSPTGRGILTGRYKRQEDFPEGDFRRGVPKFSNENISKVLKLAEQLEEIGKRHNATATQVCLAWLLAQGVVPIPGSKQLKYIEENIGAVDVKLTDADLKKLRELIDETEKGLTGNRYPPGFHEQVLVDTPPLKQA